MAKPLHLLQERDCPGKCKREDIEGDVCFTGTCEYNIHSINNQEQKEELCQLQQEAMRQAVTVAPGTAVAIPLLPTKPIQHTVIMRPALLKPFPTRIFRQRTKVSAARKVSRRK